MHSLPLHSQRINIDEYFSVKESKICLVCHSFRINQLDMRKLSSQVKHSHFTKWFCDEMTLKAVDSKEYLKVVKHEVAINYVADVKLEPELENVYGPYKLERNDEYDLNLKLHDELKIEQCYIQSNNASEPVHAETSNVSENKTHTEQVCKLKLTTGTTSYECSHCDYKTYNKRYYSKHIFTHSAVKKHQCDQCEYKTFHKSHFNRHLMTHTNLKKLQCDQCDFKTNYVRSLKDHKFSKHTDIKNYHCNQCEYKTVATNRLNRHLLKHADGNKYRCDLCHFKTDYKSALRQHFFKHIDIKNYQCAQCEYKTFRKADLKHHSLKHSNVKRYHCAHCEHKVHRKRQLILHVRKHRVNGNHAISTT